MVLHKGENLHNNPPTNATPVSKVLEYTAEDRQVIMEELKRWQSILSVNYANFKLESGVLV
ncbi:hypothetical protein IKG31_00375 [Candidatus Saccharibacteria bacterium]|nr:hypothetical protein [Candidatus Saccharibacteria bacterium]